MIVTTSLPVSADSFCRRLIRAAERDGKLSCKCNDDGEEYGNPDNDMKCFYSIDMDGKSGLPQANVFLFASYEYKSLTSAEIKLSFSGEFKGYRIPASTDTIGILVDIARKKIESCSATIRSCDCECYVCKNGKGVKPNCDNCELIPAGSGSNGSPLNPINYPETDKCIDLSFIFPDSQLGNPGGNLGGDPVCSELVRLERFLPDNAICFCSTDETEVICNLGEIDLDDKSGGLPPVEVNAVYSYGAGANNPAVTLNFSGEYNGYKIPPKEGTVTISATTVESRG